MNPTTNPKVVALAKALGVRPCEIYAGGPVDDVYVIPHKWCNSSSEAYSLGETMCAVIEKLAPLLTEEEK